ncbi:MAG TPA: phosphatase PAP2 family protein [Stellaceae bacterium]|nr:phosphatase PAP2 family protein [Stellaceae bacterium]
MRRGVAAYAAVFALAAAIFLLFPGIDLWTSGLFYRPEGHFFLGDWAPVHVIYRGVPYIVELVVIAVPALCLVALWRRRSAAALDTRAAAFLLLSLALGPGLLVNAVLKDHWGRARPAQVTEFAGTQHFTPALIPADQCARNCSFPAGHPAIGFYLVSFAFLVRNPRRRRVAEGAAIAAGALIGLTRIAQGGHFLSDVVFSGLLVYGTSWLLYRAIMVHDALRPLLERPRLLAALFGTVLAAALSMTFVDRPVARFFHDGDPRVHAVFAVITKFGLSDAYLIVSSLLFLGLRIAAARTRDAARAPSLLLNAYRALFIFAVVAASGILTDVVKVICGRARPKLLFADNFYGFTWGATQADYWSFPSGHATTAAALATALFLLWPRGLPLYVAGALLVMASRIILDAHYTSDVIAGAAIGAATARAAWLVFAQTGLRLRAGAPRPAETSAQRYPLKP